MSIATVVRYSLIVIAVASFVLAIVWFVKESGYEPFLAILGGLAASIGAFFADRLGDETVGNAAEPEQEDENVKVTGRGVYVRGEVNGSIVTGDNNAISSEDSPS